MLNVSEKQMLMRMFLFWHRTCKYSDTKLKSIGGATMKNVVLLSVLVLGVITNAFASRPNNGSHGKGSYNNHHDYNHSKAARFSQLILRTESGLNFTVIVHGNTYYSVNGEVVIANMEEGYHDVELIRDSYNRGAFVATRRVYVPFESKVFATIYHGTAMKVTRIVELQRKAAPTCHVKPHCYTPTAMCEGEFRALKARLYTFNFESDRKRHLISAIHANYFYAYQIAELVRMFTFESNKLDVAKRGFDKTIDKNKYDIVAYELNFSSSRVQLNHYIGATEVYGYTSYRR